ncbi:ferrochelatase [Fimbriimonas ginsengisoli]|uniref:Ferrochelatase n=1 Tax=Fimbriimonas ginsengisoli Gsoil 348 TaxID=661478 RepID=A0A068NLE9_FIMGI|nr:ferrochelatase [Fimbriimonas ginsengisoli]AIE84311.1 Ferrochelatase [Fimbriimonas ginsengisoli Gsoil 348]
MKPLGLLVMHYGTPASIEEVLPYYTHIRRGRPPTPEALQDLIDRYEAIGGPSPLTEISRRQAEAILAGLHRRGVDAKLYVGTKHAPPFVADAVNQMAEDGIDHAVGLVLAPHFSTFSIAAYRNYALTARDKVRPEMRIDIVERWGTLPELIDALADRVRHEMDGWDPDETLVIFSAHSLPEKIVAAGDPYQEELLETSRLVAERADVPHWTFAFQSASNTGEPWLGPDILEVIEENAPKYKNIVACTVGFVSDHLEVLFDLGIEARDKSAELGLNFRRAATINDDPAVMDALAGLVSQAAQA